MLLERLREYTHRVAPTPIMYAPTPIRWLIDLGSSGVLRGFVQMEGEARRAKRGKVCLVPQVGRTSGVRANLLADRADYVLGFAGHEANSHRRRRTREGHQAFVTLVRECANASHERSVRAVSKFLDRLAAKPPRFPPDIEPGDMVTFRVGNLLPVDLPSVRQFWADRHEKDVSEAAQGLSLIHI